MRSKDISLLNNGFNILVKLFDVFKYIRVASDKDVQRRADTCSESILSKSHIATTKNNNPNILFTSGRYFPILLSTLDAEVPKLTKEYPCLILVKTTPFRLLYNLQWLICK